jgi:hypothetical protein
MSFAGEHYDSTVRRRARVVANRVRCSYRVMCDALAYLQVSLLFRKTDKMFRERKSEQPRSHAMNKCKMQKQNAVLPFPVQQIQKATPSSTMPFPSTVALLRPRGPLGRVSLSQGQTVMAAPDLARLGIGEASSR